MSGVRRPPAGYVLGRGDHIGGPPQHGRSHLDVPAVPLRAPADGALALPERHRLLAVWLPPVPAAMAAHPYLSVPFTELNELSQRPYRAVARKPRLADPAPPPRASVRGTSPGQPIAGKVGTFAP